MKSAENRLHDHLSLLYGKEASETVWNQLIEKLNHFTEANPELGEPSRIQTLTQKDAMLITYGDQVREPGRSSLRTLGDFLRTHLDKIVPDVHILPFYPYSSDDGFSMIDYLQVNPDLGTWDDILNLGQDFRLMFDGVINHISRESEWFKGFLREEDEFMNYFIVLEPDTDLSQVFRLRALPLLRPVETSRGRRFVWTTFSEDQIDLNYANPQALLNVLDDLLFYVASKARFLPAVFTILRGEPGKDQVICLHNVSDKGQIITLDLARLGKRDARELFSGEIHLEDEILLQLKPYQTVWLGLQES